MIDLDPGDETTWADLVEIALAVRRVLELLELPSVLKTSGQRGLHILVPLAPGHTFAQAEDLARGIASCCCACCRPRSPKSRRRSARRQAAGRSQAVHGEDARRAVLAARGRRRDGLDATRVERADACADRRNRSRLRTVRARIDEARRSRGAAAR